MTLLLLLVLLVVWWLVDDECKQTDRQTDRPLLMAPLRLPIIRARKLYKMSSVARAQGLVSQLHYG